MTTYPSISLKEIEIEERPQERLLRLGCTSIVVVHNHPSGDPCPSKADIEVAKTLLKSSKIICIELLEFMIIGKKSIDPMGKGYNSFRENNLL